VKAPTLHNVKYKSYRQNMGQSYLSPAIYYDAVYPLPATHAKVGSPKHEYYGHEGTISFPNPRCVNFSNVPPSIITFTETTLYPPPAPPTPSPRCVLANPVQPPTPVEAWMAYVRSTNSTGTCGTLRLSTPETYSQTATPDA
jgi:hypothetical protein